LSLKLFTKAIGPGFYIDAGSNTVETSSGLITTYYKAFAFAWSLGSTFVLSNEAPGYLIDNLIANGYGDKNLFEVLKALQPVSGGAIPLEFVNQLAACPPGSDIFTSVLHYFGGLNNPVCINSDGTLSINAIFAKHYFGKEGYATYPESQAGVGKQLFTYAASPDYYIDAGISGTSGGTTIRYKAFAIAWSAPAVGIRDAETNQQPPSVYPNPFSVGFYFHNLPEQTQIDIFDIRGKLIYQTEPKANSMVQPGLLPKGIYILKLINSRGSWQQKIVKY
jgi:hypothetical protein